VQYVHQNYSIVHAIIYREIPSRYYRHNDVSYVTWQSLHNSNSNITQILLIYRTTEMNYWTIHRSE